MALSVPLVTDLLAFKQEQFDETMQVPMQNHLQIATDIMSLATGLTEDLPADTPMGRLVRIGIMDLAWYIGTSLEDRDAMFSPFSSERIGSYSYSKAMSAAQSGQILGVPFFDMVVAMLADADEDTQTSSVSLTTTNVMATTLDEYVYPDFYGG